MNMVPSINLLPWRENLRKERKRQFTSLSILAGGLGVVVVAMGWLVMNSTLDDWKSTNEVLNAEITSLNKQIETIKDLQEQKTSLLSRKKVIEDLQSGRGESVQMLQTLMDIPSGVVVLKMKQQGQQLQISGMAQSNSHVSMLMKNLEATPVFERLYLDESRASLYQGRKIYNFSMSAMISRAESVSEKTEKKGANK